MSAAMFTDIIKSLGEIALVPVYIDMIENDIGDRNKSCIVINQVKLLDMKDIYDFMKMTVTRVQSNLPPEPVQDKTYAAMWLLAGQDYCINNYRIWWEKSNSNTFVHMWSMVDRMRHAFDSINMFRIVGLRDCVGYSEVMGMSGSPPDDLDAQLDA